MVHLCCHTLLLTGLFVLGTLTALTTRWACNIQDDVYIYAEDLLALEGSQSPPDPTIQAPVSPISIEALKPFLACHPDQRFAQYIHRGFQRGFRIGFSGPITALKDAPRNHPSAYQHTDVVSSHLDSELEAGRLTCSLGSPPTHINPLGLVPKSGQPGQFRLITDLSSPRNRSVNDGIDRTLCSLKYAALDQAMTFIRQFGPGTLMAKMDLRNAYRVVPVHPLDQPLIGVKWNGSIYHDSALPFGLRSAPKIFTAVADALAWAMFVNGTRHFLHYLDDFLFVGPPSDSTTLKSLHLALNTCAQISFPVSHHKTVGPTTNLTFLGIEINTIEGILSLPEEKMSRLHDSLMSWKDRKSAPKRDFQSLLGHLSHASSVVRPGRIFVRHLIDASCQASAPHHYIRLNQECRADLSWWIEFGRSWNGSSLWPPNPPSFSCYTDASGNWGCGAILSTPPQLWFQLRWPDSWLRNNIAAKEMVPIVVAAAIWGHHWSGKKVLFRSDNSATVAAVQSGSARDPSLRHLLRCLFFIAATRQFDYSATHIPGVRNTAADALSRDRAHLLATLVPSANSIPSFIPLSLQDLLLRTDVSWTSTLWRESFIHSLDSVSPKTLQGHMTQRPAAT